MEKTQMHKCAFLVAFLLVFFPLIFCENPPDTPEIKIKTSFGMFLSVNKTVSVIEGLPFTLNCSATSNPVVSLFKWDDRIPTTNSTFYVENADRRYLETITCNVTNKMQVDDPGTTETGTNITTLNVDVLYPPRMNILTDKTIIEGDNLNYVCDFINGNPKLTVVTWNTKDDIILNGQLLTLINVSRYQAGVYRCSIQNKMISSDGTHMFGNGSGEFQLAVQYRTQVLNFAVNERNGVEKVTVNENDLVNISCEIEGDPVPTGELLHKTTSFIGNLQFNVMTRHSVSQTSTKLRLTSSFLALCTDTGVQTCSGSNRFYNGSQSMSYKSVLLFVTCKPRKSPYITSPDTVLCPASTDVTLSFTTLAYPVPPLTGYVWARKVEINDTWANITADGDKTIISTSGLQSNLTIKEMSSAEYGLYRLFIENDIGQFSHIFSVIPADDTTATSPSTSVITAIAAGTGIGSLFFVSVIIVVAVYKIRFRRKNVSNGSNENVNQYYNLSNPTGDSTVSAHGGFANVYEDLQQTGLDQQYQTISKVAIKQGEHRVYENMQIKHKTEKPQTGESSGAIQTTLQKEQTQTSV